LYAPNGSRPEDTEGAVVAVQLHTGGGQVGGDAGQTLGGNGRMHQQRVQGVADVGAAHFSVNDDAGCHIQVCRPVNVGVADADATGDRRHGGVLSDETDQPVAASRHYQVDVLAHFQHGIHECAVRVVHELHGPGGGIRFSQGAANQANERGV
jgi:hypothetical protein